MRKRILSIFLSICIIATLSISAPVSAVSIPDPNTDLSLGNVVIDSDGTYTITQSEDRTTSNTITINSNATVYLDGVNIEADAPTSTSDFSRTNPININGDYTVNLYLVDGSQNTLASKEGIGGISTTNPITSGSAKAALRVPAGATLNIYGDTGVLDATGAQAHNNSDSNAHGGGGAGIGGNGGISHSSNGSQAESSGTINIYGGIINATGGETTGYWGDGGSGIGSGGKRYAVGSAVSGDVTINGGTVTATGGNGGNSSISGYAIGGKITINGGHLIARSASSGATIRSPLSEQPLIPNSYKWRTIDGSEFFLSSDSTYSYSNTQNYVEISVIPAAYKVEHYKETLAGGFELANTDNLTGTTAASVTATAKIYTGFNENTSHSNRNPSGTINADGSTVLKLYYDRNLYAVTFKNHDGTTINTQSVKYEGSATAPTAPTRTGYTFSGWNEDFSSVTSDIEATANYTANTDTTYQVQHYKETLAGGFELANTDNLTGTTAASVTATAKIYTGFNENTSHSNRVNSGTINADGSTVLKLYYDRNEYSVRYVNHDGSVMASDEVAYGDFTEAPATPVRAYHSFAGWFTDNDTFMNEWIFAEKQVTAATTLYTKWTKIPQSITHVNIDDQTKVAVDGLSNKVNLTEIEIENAADIFVFVKADPIQISESIQKKVESEIDRKGLKLLNVFDIGLYKRVTTYEGVSTETSISNEDILGKIIVRIPLTEEQAKKDNLAIAYIDDEGNITIIAGKIISEGEVKYFEFETDHFSTYSLVETSIVNIPVTGEKTDSRMPLGLLALLFAMGVLIVTKRKLTKEEIE